MNKKTCGECKHILPRKNSHKMGCVELVDKKMGKLNRPDKVEILFYVTPSTPACPAFASKEESNG